MTQELDIVNKVANSGLITLNPEDFRYKGKRVFFDLKDQLFQGLILREKDLREFVKTHDWTQYQDALMAIGCSVDAIIPAWAYMLVAIQLKPYAPIIVHGNLQDLEKALTYKALDQVDFSQYEGQKIVVKGCGGVFDWEYLEFAHRLLPYAQSIMYGEPCSTIPLFKRKANK